MEGTYGGDLLSPTRTSGSAVDRSIADLADMRICDVVALVEGTKMVIGFPGGNRNASMYLVGRLFTDAVFSQDIRAIQIIINRIDGGLPKDTEIADYKTRFGDCLSEVMAMENGLQLKVDPEDSVMMALCKSLYSIAVEDIYWNNEKKKPRKPTDAQKRDRDSAMRMVLERTGGRKTMSTVEVSKEELGTADWIERLQLGTCETAGHHV